jgi:hypothetical protein
MLKAIWKLLLMFNGVSSEDDEREARRARERERLRREEEGRAGRETARSTGDEARETGERG